MVNGRWVGDWCAVALLCGTLGAQASDLVVKTDHGKVQGKMSADGQSRDFLGIPFAAPPVGPLRWKAPQPAAKWKGTREATAFGFRCMQQTSYNDMVFRDPGESEDCLTLNVWVPATAKAGSKLPVMVWIYGGGFTAGTTSEPRQDGEHLTRKGVIVVSMNYRLGIFGFLATSALEAEDAHHAAGNYGLMDETAAMQWVHQNVAAFGGDPGNVTIFGESAGSFAVNSQMASPVARGLFAHAIGESGGFTTTTLDYPPLAEIAPKYEAYLQKATPDSSLAALRALSSAEVLKLGQAKEIPSPRFGPDIDGYFLPKSKAAIFAAGEQSRVPLLAGWNQDEQTGEVVKHPERQGIDGLHATAVKDFGDDSADFLKVFGGATDAEATRAAEDYAGDKFLVYSTWAWLEAQVKSGSPAYRYYFAQPSPGDPYHEVSAGAFHSDEIEYVFGNLDSRKGAHFTPEDYKVSELLQTYWTNFAKTGDPNGAGAPQWLKYDAAGNWQVMRLSADAAAAPDAHRARYLFLQGVWDK